MESTHKTNYYDKGFIELNSIIHKETIVDINSEIERIITDFPELCTFENWAKGNDDYVLHKISKFTEKSNVFWNVAYNSKIISIIEEILDEPCFLCTDKINFKLSGGRGFYPHQDMSGIWSNYVKNIISVFIAIDDSNEHNGCLQVAEGWHKKGLLGDKMCQIKEPNLSLLNFKNLIQKSGDIIIFDGFLPHQSMKNFSSSSRRILLLTYNRKSEGNYRELFLDGK